MFRRQQDRGSTQRAHGMATCTRHAKPMCVRGLLVVKSTVSYEILARKMGTKLAHLPTAERCARQYTHARHRTMFGAPSNLVGTYRSNSCIWAHVVAVFNRAKKLF